MYYSSITLSALSTSDCGRMTPCFSAAAGLTVNNTASCIWMTAVERSISPFKAWVAELHESRPSRDPAMISQRFQGCGLVWLMVKLKLCDTLIRSLSGAGHSARDTNGCQPKSYRRDRDAPFPVRHWKAHIFATIPSCYRSLDQKSQASPPGNKFVA